MRCIRLQSVGVKLSLAGFILWGSCGSESNRAVAPGSQYDSNDLPRDNPKELQSDGVERDTIEQRNMMRHGWDESDPNLILRLDVWKAVVMNAHSHNQLLTAGHPGLEPSEMIARIAGREYLGIEPVGFRWRDDGVLAFTYKYGGTTLVELALPEDYK